MNTHYKKILFSLKDYLKSKVIKKTLKDFKLLNNFNKASIFEENNFLKQFNQQQSLNVIAYQEIATGFERELKRIGKDASIEREEGLVEFDYNLEDKREFVKMLLLPLGVFLLKLFNDEEKKMFCEDKETKNEANDIVNFKRPYLGCSIRQKEEGMQIVMIRSGSPAEKAGLAIRDIILEIDGQKTCSINEYYSAIGQEKGKKNLKIKKFKAVPKPLNESNENPSQSEEGEYEEKEITVFFD